MTSYIKDYYVIQNEDGQFWKKGEWHNDIRDAHFYLSIEAAQRVTIDPRFKVLHCKICNVKLVTDKVVWSY